MFKDFKDFAVCPLCHCAFQVGWKEPDGELVCYECGRKNDYARQRAAKPPPPPKPWYIRLWAWLRGVQGW